jgi:hypothetical protein
MQQHQVQLQPCACSSKSALKREVLESLFSFKFNKVERNEEREREINQWPGKAKDLLEKEMVVEIMKRH